MQKSGYISIDDIHTPEKLAQLAAEISLSIQLILPSHTPDPLQLETATLAILAGDTDEIIDFFASDRLAQTVPILYLGTENQVNTLPKHIPNSRFIDILTLPAPVNVFIHKLHFLTKVYKLSIENQNQETTLNQQLEIFYNRDGLTGLYTRRHLTDQLQIFLESSIKNNQELSLLILNIDYFNNVNKSFGLGFGDFLLNAMAARLTNTTPKEGSCYRFSGEDFVVLLPNTDLKAASKIADNINRVCSETPFWDGEQTVSITLSIGIASLQNHHPEDRTEFLCMAETALFSAKANGRNRTQTYTPHDGPKGISSQHTLALLKENLSKILERTRNSAIASLQLLTSNVAEPGHQEHIKMVSDYLDLFAQQLGLPKHYTQTFKNSIALYSSFRCLLHKDIYSKPDGLSIEEKMTIQDLPFKLNELVDMFDYFAKERNVLLSHCERYDGTGYPLGLEQDEIPLGARIFHIIDALAAMNGDRPYRKKLMPVQIIDEFLEGAGKQFDPHLVVQIFKLIENFQVLDIDPLTLEEKQQQLLEKFPEYKQ